MSLLSYSGLSTKLRAMTARLLSDEQFRHIAEMPTVADAAAYLKSTPTYGPCFPASEEHLLHRSDIERILYNSVYEDMRKIYRFSNSRQRSCLAPYLQMFEVDFLKRCLNCIFDHRDVDVDLPVMRELFVRHSCLDLERLAAASTIDEFVSALSGTPYHDAFLRLVNTPRPVLFDYEIALDIFHFTTLWKERTGIADGNDLTQLTRIYGSKFDLLNIQWIKRSKQYYRLTPAQIRSFLIPVRYKLKKEDILAMTEAEDMAGLAAAIHNTYYGAHFEELTPETLEITYISIMKSILSRSAKANPYSLAVIFNYFYQKRHEVTRLIIALECVRYGMDPEQTMRRIATN